MKRNGNQPESHCYHWIVLPNTGIQICRNFPIAGALVAEAKKLFEAASKTADKRNGNEVHVYMTTIRTHFAPDNIEGVRVGDEVYFHVTNLEQDWDVPHGVAVMGAGERGAPGHARADPHAPVGAQGSRHLPVLLHGLLLRAPPGDAGLHPSIATRVERPAHSQRRLIDTSRAGRAGPPWLLLGI